MKNKIPIPLPNRKNYLKINYLKKIFIFSARKCKILLSAEKFLDFSRKFRSDKIKNNQTRIERAFFEQ